jgi:hypothetical protein
MNRLGRIMVSCALTALLAGCDKLPDVYEDVGNDPHPPSLTLLAIGLGTPDPAPEPTPAAALDSRRSVTYFPPDAVLTVRPYDSLANTLTLRVSYADAAGDIDSIVVEDLDGSIGGNLALPDFVGTSGTLEDTLDIPTTSETGTHNLRIWAQDANGSRSPKTSFAVVVELF